MNFNFIKQEIKNLAFDLGFVGCGFSNTNYENEVKAIYTKYIESRFYAKMEYLKDHSLFKPSPHYVLNNTKTIIVFAAPYPVNPQISPIAAYAFGEDYHLRLKRELKKIVEFITSKIQCNYRICVDSCPLPERYLAQRAGIGWIGKSGNLIVPDSGPNVHLGEILLDIDFPPDQPMKNQCGKCNLCVEACPVGAIKENGFVDANLCLSYHTIESKTSLPIELLPYLNGRFFGCEICVAVCPYLKQNKYFAGQPFKHFEDEKFIDLPNFSFKKTFKNTVLERSSKKKLILNWVASIASGKNKNSKKLLKKLKKITTNSELKHTIDNILDFNESFHKGISMSDHNINQKTIMVVDDEQMILRLTERLLARKGYNVLTAQSGKAAIEIYQAKQQEIDLIILDLSMPQMSGEEVFRNMQSINENVKVLISSGYGLDDNIRDLINRGCAGFIKKPYEIEDFYNQIESIIQ